IIKLMSIKDLEVELNKIKGHSRNKWNNIIDSIAKKECSGQYYIYSGFSRGSESQSIDHVEELSNR
ncbi:31484_t:CDS:1, partial [Gigaspora margarita]